MNNTEVNSNEPRLVCNTTIQLDDLETYQNIAWWLEYVLQSVIGVAGIIANTMAIPVLCCKDMYSIFNRLLIFLAIFDNFFIICQILEAKRKMSLQFEGYFEFNQIHEYAFGYFLYQLHAYVLCCSIYITVALALERYRAVWRPVEYHNKYKGVNPWKQIMKSYVGPVLVFSMIFNIPKCFETEFEEIPVLPLNVSDSLNVTNGTTWYYLVRPTEFRFNDTYVLLYSNIARLLVQGVIPFISLSFLNYRIYWVIKRRRKLKNRPRLGSNTDNGHQLRPRRGSNLDNGDHLLNIVETQLSRASFSAERKVNEAKQAVVLFMIVLLFFICHTPRQMINIHEFINLDLLKRGMDSECDKFPVLAFTFTSISHCLMTLNSSSNFYIYCFMCSTFRSVLYRWILGGWNFVLFKFGCRTCIPTKEPNQDQLAAIYTTRDDNQVAVIVGNVDSRSINHSPKIHRSQMSLNNPDIILNVDEN